MEGPGMSLFQGGPSIHINNSAQDRLEEQEELEDQRRRNEELKHELENAFDDFIDDDEASSVNSSRNLDATHSNGIRQHTRSGLPPSYVESLNHLKEGQPVCESPKLYCETPKNHQVLHSRHQEEPIKLPYNPYAAGDAQNHYYPQEFRGHANGINQYDARQEYMNNEQLKVMYEMRVKECQQLAAQVEKSDTEIESLQARLSAAIHDKNKAELSLQEAHQLLAASKHRAAEQEAAAAARAQAAAAGEAERDALRLQLRAADAALHDAQQRLHTLQVAHTHDTDALFREQQDRHREEVDRLQNDLIKAKHRLDEKENEIKMLEKRCMERDREKEEILIEKGATINRLASELEAAQNRLVSGESARLKEKVLQLTTERNAAKEQVKELGSKLEVTAHELVMCRNKLSASQKEYENWRTTLNQILMESLPDNAYNIGEPPSPGKLATLKEILSRYKQQSQKFSSLQEEMTKREKQHRKQESELRAKLDEQKGVEMQLNSRIAVLQNKLDLLETKSEDGLIESYKQQNEQLRNELEDVRAELKNLELKYTEVEMDHEKLKSEKGGRASVVREANAELLRELDRTAAHLKDLRRENAELKTLYLQVCSTRDAVNREMKDVQAKIQKEKDLYKSQEKDYIERIEKEKRQVQKLTSDLSSTKEELDRANKRISELQKEFTDKQKEFSDKLNKYLEDEKSAMRKEMEPCSQCEKQLKHIRYLDDQLSKCTAKLATQESNETLMNELKGKAEFFQNYIMERYKKLQEQRSVATNTDESSPPQNAPCTEEVKNDNDNDDAFAAKTALMMKEKAIRDQIAEKFTLEMKTVEMNCVRRLKEMENEQHTAVTKLKDLLERKAHEVETLKEFILAERAKVTQILESKEKEISVLIKEHNELHLDCQKAKDSVTEWKLKVDRYKEKLSRLTSLEEMLTKEREDWKQRMSSYAKEWQSLKTKSVELQSQLSQLEQKYVKLQMEHQTIQEKYRNAKKTVFTYKDYMAQKDTHINNEINRIQDEYRKIFIKLQSQLNYYVNSRMQEEKNKGKPSQSQQFPQYDYSEKMDRLHEEFTRLAKSDFKETENLDQ